MVPGAARPSPRSRLPPARGGDVGLAGGAELASRVAAEVGRISPARPDVVPTAVDSAPVLRGAILAAVDQARAELLDSVATR